MKKDIDKPLRNTHFKVMSFCFNIRDLFSSPEKKVKKAKIKLGDYVLDYGCGPGSFSIAAVELVGPSGKVYAADIHPLSAEKVIKKASRKGLKNIEAITTDCDTGLNNESIDIVLCFDVYHDLGDPISVLKEFYRVLKPTGILSLDDHHLSDEEIITKITEKNLFKFTERIDRMHFFSKIYP